MWIVLLSTPLFILLIIIEMIADRFHHKKNYRLNDFFANVNCGIGHQILSQFANVVGVGLYILAYENLKLFIIPVNLLTNIILFVAIDFLYYWAHRLFHQVNFLWTDHSVHHLGEDYNLAAALRLGYYQILYAYVSYLPLALFGFQPEIFIILLTLSTLYQFINHTEKIGKLGFLEKILITPSHHRVHHGRNPEYIDKNFGGFFIIWDKIFKTFKEEKEQVIYGITTPPNSFNPLYIQIHYLKTLINDYSRVEGFSNKVKLLFKKPGWLPDELGGPRMPPPIDIANYQRYDLKLPSGLNQYLLVHSMILMLVSFFFLIKLPEMQVVLKASAALLIFLGIFSIGVMFDGKKWAFFLECLRFCLTFIFLAYLPIEPVFVYILYAVFMLASLYFCFNFFYNSARNDFKIPTSKELNDNNLDKISF